MKNEVRDFAVDLLKILTSFAMGSNRTVGENQDFYVTLEELQDTLKKLLEKYGR